MCRISLPMKHFQMFYSRFFLHSLINWLTRYLDLPFFPRILREFTFLCRGFEIFHLPLRNFAVFVFLQILACYCFFLTSDTSDFWDIEVFQFSCRDLEIWIPWNTLPLLGAHIWLPCGGNCAGISVFHSVVSWITFQQDSEGIRGPEFQKPTNTYPYKNFSKESRATEAKKLIWSFRF